MAPKFKRRVRQYQPRRKPVFPRKDRPLNKTLSDAEIQGAWSPLSSTILVGPPYVGAPSREA
jgi:hypothetical protein